VHTLYCVQKYGVIELEKFQELLTEEEVQTCKTYTQTSWYTMPRHIFSGFIFKVSLESLLFFCMFDSLVSYVTSFSTQFVMTITSIVVLSFIQQEISAATDAAIRKLKEENLEVEVSREAVAATMRSTIKDSTNRHYKKLSKIVSVVNPALIPHWLKEVQELPYVNQRSAL